MTDEDLAKARSASRAGDHATALAIYRRCAESGDMRAQDELGMIFTYFGTFPRQGVDGRIESGTSADGAASSGTPITALNARYPPPRS